MKKPAQLRSRSFVVLTYCMYAPGAKGPAALLDSLFDRPALCICYLIFLSRWASRVWNIFEGNEDRESHHGRPPAWLSDGGLGDVLRANNFSAHFEHLLSFLPGHVGVKLDAKRGGEHLRRQIFGVIASLFVGLSTSMMFREIAICLVSALGDGHAY